jgi:hypothetical protein
MQKDLKQLQLRLIKSKEDVSQLCEKQCILLTEAFLQQGMNLPAEVPVDAPASSPADPHDPRLIPGWDFTSEECTQQEMASHGWGNVRQSNAVYDNGGAQFLLTHRPLHHSQLWMDPILDLLTPNRRTDGTITKDPARDPGKAREITVPISMEYVVESRETIGADGMTVITAPIVTVQIVMSARKLGLLMVSPSP